MAKRTINIAPYKVELNEEQRITYIRVRDEFGKQVLRANYNKYFERYESISITVKDSGKIHEMITVMETLVTEAL